MGLLLGLGMLAGSLLMGAINDKRASDFQQGYQKDTAATSALDRKEEAIVGQFSLREDWLHLDEAKLRREYDELAALEDDVRTSQGNASASAGNPFSNMQTIGGSRGIGRNL